MARKAREKSSTGMYAVMLRSNDYIFNEKSCKDIFRSLIKERFGENLKGLRFCDDSVHMLLCESESGLAVDLKPVIISFARTYNRGHKCEGRVFRDRFRSVPVEDPETEAECMRYLNGGKKAAPFIMRGQEGNAGVTENKRKPRAQKAKAEKPSQAEAAVQEPEKPKKKNQMPTWLL